MNLSDEDKFIFGNQDVIAHLYSEHRPYIHVDGTTQQMAYLSDVLPKAEIQVFEELPLVGETNVMYFVKDKVESVYAIFLWDSAKRIFVLAGDSNMVLDDYYNKNQTDSLFLAKSGGYMNGEIDLANNIGIIGFTSSGDKVNLIKLNSSSIVNVGDTTKEITIFSKNPPDWNNGFNSYNFITSNGGLLTNRLLLANNVSLMGRNLAGQDISLIKINDKDEIIVGSDTNWLKLSANNAPLWSGQGADTPLATETYIANNYLPLNGGVVTGAIGLSNNTSLYGISNDGETIPLVGVSGGVNVNVGGSNRPLMLQSSQRPSWNNADSIQELSTLQDIDTKVGKDYRVISETLEINGVVSTIATFDAPDVAQALANIQNYEITFNYSYVSSDGKLIIENHLGTSDNNELMQINLDIPSAKNAINIKAHALGSTISVTNFVITCHIRPLNLDM